MADMAVPLNNDAKLQQLKRLVAVRASVSVWVQCARGADAIAASTRARRRVFVYIMADRAVGRKPASGLCTTEVESTKFFATAFHTTITQLLSLRSQMP